MEYLLTPKLDIVFKLLFTQDTEILIDLLNGVLEFPPEHLIRSVDIKNPTILPEEPAKKHIVLDILAIDNDNRQYDIEMQALKYAFYPKRTVYYLCKMYAGQLDSGEQYGQLTPVIGVHFLNYDEYPQQQDFHFCFELRDVRYPQLRLTKNLSLHLFELPKFERMVNTIMAETKMREWLHFLNHAHEEVDETARSKYTNPAIQKAFSVLEHLSSDEEARSLAEMREKALKDQVSALAEALEEGMEKGREEGIKEGMEKGELIGEIRLAQYQLELPLSSKDELAQQTLEALRTLYQDLQSRLQQRSERDTLA